jgi:peptide/nickel transport system substrate-binding protein
MRPRFAFARVLFAAFFLATTTPALVSAKPEGTLVIALATLGGEVLIPFMGTSSNKPHWDLLYDYLIDVSADGKMIPALASKWTVSKDRKVWAFDLRKGVKFHNGDELTAEDVKFSIELAMRDDSRLSRAFELRQVLDRIEVQNPYRLVVHTKSPYSVDDSLSERYGIGIVPKAYIEKVGLKHAAENPVGSGPAKFMERRLGEYIKLEALDQHWRTTPHFRTFILKQVAEHTTRVAMLRTGEADIIDLPSFMVDGVKKAGFDVRISPLALSTWLTLGGQYLPGNPVYNVKTPWLKKEVRQALNLAVNRDEIAKYIFKGTAKPAALPYLMPGALGWDDRWKPYPYEPERAKKMLSDSGYSNGFDITIRTFSMSGLPEMPQIAEAVATYWAKIGVKAKLVPMEYVTHRPDYQNSRLAPLAFPFRYSFEFNLTRQMTKAFYSKAKGTHAEFVGLEPLASQLVNEVNLDKQAELIHRMGQIIYDEYLTVPIAYTSIIYGVSKKVGDWPMITGMNEAHHLEFITRRER